MDEAPPQPEPTTPQEAARDLAVAVRQATEDMRVVLRERFGVARVRLGQVWHEDVPIVIAQAEESEARVADSLRKNAVVLKDAATHALVRINDELIEKVPLFQEIPRKGEDLVDEVRVRVAEIRERVEKKGLFGRRK